MRRRRRALSRGLATVLTAVALAGAWPALLTAVAPAGAWPTPGALHAQQVERERQEAILPAAGLTEIDAALRARLDLFPEVEGFRAARLLVRQDGAVVLEIESAREGRLERERRILDGPRLQAFRDDLQARLAEAAVRAPADQVGRGGLVLEQTLIGLAYHGWAVPVALDVESARVAVAAYLLTGGTAFALPYFLTRHRPVTESHRDLTFYGSTRGIGAGVLIGDALTSRDADSPERVRLAAGVAAGAAGAAIGYAAAEAFGPDDGTAALWAAMGDFGFAAGATLAYVAGPYASETVRVVRDEFTFEETRARNPRLGHAVTLAGGAAGMGAGAWLARRQPFTEGNVWSLRSAGVLGAQVGLTAARAVSDEGRPIAAAGVAGGAAGIALGARWLRDRRFTEGEGLLVVAGHLAGGATALGLTYLAVENVDQNTLTYMTTGTLGSLAGAALVARALDPGSARAPFGGGGSESAARRDESGTSLLGSVSVEMDPTGVVAALFRSQRPARILTLRF